MYVADWRHFVTQRLARGGTVVAVAVTVAETVVVAGAEAITEAVVVAVAVEVLGTCGAPSALVGVCVNFTLRLGRCRGRNVAYRDLQGLISEFPGSYSTSVTPGHENTFNDCDCGRRRQRPQVDTPGVEHAP